MALGVGLLVVTVALPVSAYRGLNDRWWVAFDGRGLSLLKGAGPGGYGPFHLHNASAVERFPTDREDLPGLVAGMLERGVAVGGRSEGRRVARCLPLLFTPAPNAPPSGGDPPRCDGRLLDDPPRVAVPWRVTLPLATEHPPALLAADGRLLLAWRDPDSNHLHLAASPDGARFGEEITLDETSDLGPSLWFADHTWVLSWIGRGGDRVNLLSSSDGEHFGTKTVLEATSADPPAVTGGDVWVLAWTRSRDGSTGLLVSRDGSTRFVNELALDEPSAGPSL